MCTLYFSIDSNKYKPAQFIHIRTPKSIEAHLGPLALQSAHCPFSAQLSRIY